jgi:hypothetical protein
VLGFALVVGAVAFLNGLFSLLLLMGVGGDPQRKLFEINVYLGTAIVTLSLGGMLVYQAAASLGGVGSNALRLPRGTKWWVLCAALLFPFLVYAGQQEVNSPERLPLLFPLTNVAIVCVPSAVAALVVTLRYRRVNPLAWPISAREWTSAIIYGAVGATFVAAIINTAYLELAGAWLIHMYGNGPAFDLETNLPSLPRGLGVAFDLSVLSVVAPLNEEFWKGMIVAFFFFRKGGAARCFVWGVLAGAGFNLLETFQNSLSVVSPDVVSARTIGSEWWLFAVARAGTGAVHATATGLSALGFYGLLRRRPRFAGGYPLGILVHGTWNFFNYTLAGDAFLSRAGPDSTLLDILSVAGLVALFVACAALLWELPGRLRESEPAMIYRVIGMLPGRSAGIPTAEPATR